jgi:tetratricopeptide (TPR) repeat protein
MTTDAEFPNPDSVSEKTSAQASLAEENNRDRWQTQIEACKADGNYLQAVEILAAAIEAEPHIKSYYWQLGLMQLLAGAEEEAQVTWMFAMTSDDTESTASDAQELVQTLEQEAQRQEAIAAYLQADLMRQYINQIDSTNLANLLALIRLGISQNALDQDLIAATTEQLLAQVPQTEAAIPTLSEPIGNQILLTLQSLLKYVTPDRAILDFIAACLPYLHQSEHDREAGTFLLLTESNRFGFSLGQNEAAIALVEFCLNLDPDNLIAWSYLAQFHQNTGNYDQGLAAARTQLARSHSLVDRLSASQMILRGLLFAGSYWQESLAAFQQHLAMMAELVATNPKILAIAIPRA